MEELTIEKKIYYSGIAARVLMAASVIFIGFGASVKLLQNAEYGNVIMGTGLVFVALFGVAVYVKNELTKRITAGKTFHG
jgi:hypothetical protein